MPKGPNGQKRPADAIGLAVMIGKIATGEIDDNSSQATRREAGALGGKTRAEKMSPEQRSTAAQIAAHKRWQK